jgi:hypothetical protein
MPSRPAGRGGGRPPLAAAGGRAVLGGEDVALIRRLALQITPSRMGALGRTRADTAFYQWQQLAGERCPEWLRERILARKIPDSIKGLVALPADLFLQKRGPRAAALRTVAGHRADRLLVPSEATGLPECRILLAGDVWDADDMHLNIPFWTECDDPALESAARWGARVARAQLLAVQDMRSRRILAFGICSRRNDAYGAYDILWVFGKTFRQYGLPRVALYLEHGSRKSLAVGQLRRLGTNIVHAQTARGKRVEGAFNEIQAHMAGLLVIRAHQAANGLYAPGFARYEDKDLGRVRGEHEAAKKLWLALRAGGRDPRAAGVMHLSEMMEFVAQAVDSYNARPMGRATMLAGRSPDQVWEAEAGGLRRLTAIEEWLVAPGITNRAIADGWAIAHSLRFEDAHILYHGPAAGALGNRFNFELRWDAANPGTAALFSRHQAAHGITRGAFLAQCPDALVASQWTPGQLLTPIQPGDFLGLLRKMDKAPVLDLTGLKGAGHYTQSRAMRDYLKTQHSAFVALTGPGKRAGRHYERHDGRGNSLTVEGAHLPPLAPGFALPEVPPERRAPAPAGDAPATLTRTTRTGPAAPAHDAGADLTRRLYGDTGDIFAGEEFSLALNESKHAHP